MTNQEIWAMAEREGGIRLTYEDDKSATSVRHGLHRWRKKNGGYADFVVRIDGPVVIIRRRPAIKIETLEGEEPTPAPLEELAKTDEHAASVLRLRERLNAKDEEH